MQAVLKRGYYGDDCVMGMLSFYDAKTPPLFTLENPWKFNKPYISCIPKGSYTVAPFSGNKYKDVYQVLDVPKRTHILFHSGNIEMDTQGCILLGLSAGRLEGHNAVLQSRAAVDILRDTVKDNEFILTIC